MKEYYWSWIIVATLFFFLELPAQTGELEYHTANDSAPYSISLGSQITLGFDSAEVIGRLTGYSAETLSLDSITYPIEEIKYFRKRGGSKLTSCLAVGAGAVLMTGGILVKEDGFDDSGMSNVAIPMGAVLTATGIVTLINPKHHLGEEGEFSFDVEPIRDSIVEVFNVDTSYSILIRYVLRKEQLEHVLRVGDFMNLTVGKNAIYKGFIQEIRAEGIVLSSRFITFESITKLKIKGVKRRSLAGGILLGLGLYSGAVGSYLVHEANQDPTLGGAFVKAYAGASAIASGVVYTTVGAIVISSFGRLNVRKNGVEFKVIGP